MTERYPVIQIRTENNQLRVRDGIVVCFFMRRDHHTEIAQAVWNSLQTYVKAIPPGTLRWHGPLEGDEISPLDGEGWILIRESILNSPQAIACNIELFQSEHEVGGYSFEYHGYQLSSFLGEDERAVCSVCFSLPTEALLEHGPDKLRALALELSREFPFSFGYASLALLPPSGDWYPYRKQLLPILERYWGMDLCHLMTTSSSLGTGARGAYWLTFLGQPLLGRLGGLEALKSTLPFPEVSFQSLEGERLLLTLGQWPEAMDTREPLEVPHFRALARLLEPFFPEEEIGLVSLLDYRDMGRWLRRFCL